MKKVIMLIGGAMLLVINQLSAQINYQYTESKPTYEVGLTTSGYGASSLSFKKFKNPDEYYRLDLGFGFGIRNNHKILNGQFVMSFGKEKIIPITSKLSFYHGWNLNYTSQAAGAVTYGDIYRMQSLSIGYRLGMRYDINKRFYIGAEISPQIGVYRSNINTIMYNGARTGLGKFATIGSAAINFGVKF